MRVNAKTIFCNLRYTNANIIDPQQRRYEVNRLQKPAPGTKPQWGKLTAPEVHVDLNLPNRKFIIFKTWELCNFKETKFIAMARIFLMLTGAVLMMSHLIPVQPSHQTNKITPPCVISCLSKTQILTGSTWIVDEVFSNTKGRNLHYVRKGINTTGHDYTAFILTFNADGTGTYACEGDGFYNTTWKFTSPDEHNMILILENGQSYNWSMVEISENSFQSITDMYVDRHDLLQSTRYIPVAKECSRSTCSYFSGHVITIFFT